MSKVVVRSQFYSFSSLEEDEISFKLDAIIGAGYVGSAKTGFSKQVLINGNRGIYVEGINLKKKKLNKTYFTNMYFIMGDRDEMFVFIGLSEKKHKTEMELTLEDMLDTLKF